MNFQKWNWWNNTFNFFLIIFFPPEKYSAICYENSSQSHGHNQIPPVWMTFNPGLKRAKSDIKVQFKHLIRERWLMATNLKSHLQTKTQARACDDLCHMATNKAISPEVGQIYQYCWLNWLCVFCQTPKHVSMFLSSREN